MPRPDEKQPGLVLCAHCGAYEGKVACPTCRYLVCGPCAMEGCRDDGAPELERSPLWIESVTIDAERRTVQCDGQSARLEDVLEVIVESGRFAGWGDLHYEYRVRIVLGDRQADFFAVRIRSLNPMRDLDSLVTARGDALARALGVKLRVERG